MELASQQACAYCGSYTDRRNGFCCLACEHLSDLKIPASFDDKAYLYLDQDNFRNLYRHEAQHSVASAKGLAAQVPKKVVGFISQHYRLPEPNAPPAEGDTYLFYVEGLHCTSCIHLLEKLPQLSSDILTARIHFGKSTLTVSLSPSGSLAKTAALIKSLGYEPIPLTPSDSVDALRDQETKADLLRIGVAGFCAGNMLLFVVPLYGGLTGQLADYFHLISLALFLPVLLYSATPFYRGAWTSLKYRTLGVDLPITVAVLSGFFMSLANLVRGDGNVYFDSTASFLFFILAARFLLKKSQQQLLSSDQAKRFYKNQKYQRADGSELIPWEQIKPGDTLKLLEGQITPSESELLSPLAHMDMSLFSGESLPRTFTQGMTLFGGSRVMGPEVQVRVLSEFKKSRLGGLFGQLEEAMASKNSFVSLADKLAQGLILVVFAAAAIFFAIYASVDISEAFNRSLALIILACPCALAFGTPLAYALTMKLAQDKGVLIRNSEVLDRALSLEHIFFDKTGTLTSGELSLTGSIPSQISREHQKIILSLESASHHPVAFALRKSWPGLVPAPLSVSQEPKGLSAQVGDHFYQIRELTESGADQIAVEFLKDGKRLAQLYFSDPLREEAKAVLKALESKGLQPHLISGDKSSRVLKVAQKLGIDSARGDLSPEDKKSILSSFANNLMIGDGANDALALDAAGVGVAMQGSVDLSVSSADVTFTRKGLKPLLDLLAFAERARKTLVRNLTVSLVYNLAGAILALLGFINPMMAAILMPVSSVLIIFSTLWGVRA